MTKPYTGGCACGAIRYATSSEPIFQNHCQCRDCQKRSGTGHGSYLTFARARRHDDRGEATHWRSRATAATRKVHAFCPVCGTPVYLTFAAMPDLIAVNATSLDDPGQFDPQVVTYTIRGHAWDTIDPCAADIRANAARLMCGDFSPNTGLPCLSPPRRHKW